MAQNSEGHPWSGTLRMRLKSFFHIYMTKNKKNHIILGGLGIIDYLCANKM